MVSVTVVIPVRDDAGALGHAVESVFAQSDLVDEVVIAVGPSSDGTDRVASELANAYPNVVVVENPSGRTPAGLNAAIAVASSPVIVRVDARSVLPDDYITNALETMQQTGAGNVGAIQRPHGETVRQRGIAAAMRSRFGSGGVAYRTATERQRVDTAYLGVFRRDALLEVGGYDESFIRNQDAELNFRLNRAGHEVWLDPRLVVDYFPRPTLAKLASQYWQYGWWRQRTIQVHKRSVRLRHLPAPLLVIAMAVSLVLAAIVTPWALALPVLYLVAILIVGLAGPGSLVERLVTSAALCTMHISWGAASIASFLTSLVRR